jgi:hypothetical protein
MPQTVHPVPECGPEAQATYAADGFVVARGLFSCEEVDHLNSHFMRLRAEGVYEGDFAGVDLASEDPLKRFPRMIHMHRWDETSLKWMIDPRLNRWLTALLGREPLAVQTMLYFKPPGARGQALHQDQYYLKVKPGTCMAAWLALDRCDEANGCMQVAPGSHLWPLLCPQMADTSISFTDTTVPLPPGQPIRPVLMAPGDVLFFNGSLVHGSYTNTTHDRFRRALIGHYIAGEAEQVGGYYHPILRMDGNLVTLGMSPDGGPCGLWAEIDGRPEITMRGQLTSGQTHE